MFTVIYLSFALSLSLTSLSAVNIVDLVSTIIFSTFILRVIELLVSSKSSANISLLFCMEVSTIALLVPSIGLELISIGFRSFSLGFRIFANVAAGHILSDIALASRYISINSSLAFLWQFVFSTLLVIYECLVAAIQLGVFISLILVYVE